MLAFVNHCVWYFLCGQIHKPVINTHLYFLSVVCLNFLGLCNESFIYDIILYETKQLFYILYEIRIIICFIMLIIIILTCTILPFIFHGKKVTSISDDRIKVPHLLGRCWSIFRCDQELRDHSWWVSGLYLCCSSKIGYLNARKTY